MARRNTTTDTRMEHIGQGSVRDMPTDGPARITPAVVDIVEGPDALSRADELAFAEEFVEVMVHDTTDPKENKLIQVAVNGRNQYFFRGERQKVRRKFIEVLARAKKTSYTQEKYRDANGADAMRNVPHTALQYPFTVMNDPNPKGVGWLRRILAST